MDRRTFCRALPAAALVSSLAPLPARAQRSYPSRAIRVISPYAAGGGPDVQLRQAAPRLEEALGQSVVIENKVGAAGVLAAQFVSSQPNDGYTLLLGSNTHLIQKILQPQLNFDPIEDFAPVSSLMASPTVLIVAADSPYRHIDDLIADARDKPGRLNYGSGGIGTSAHLAGATLVSLEDLNVMHIPLRGSVEITASLLRGDTQFAFPVAGTAMPQIEGGKVRALAVTSRVRLEQLPDVPTLQESLGDELAIQESWFSIWAPAGTPAEVQDIVHGAVTQAVQSPSLRQAYQAAGNQAVACASPAEFAAFVREENAKWAEVIALTGITVNS